MLVQIQKQQRSQQMTLKLLQQPFLMKLQQMNQNQSREKSKLVKKKERRLSISQLTSGIRIRPKMLHNQKSIKLKRNRKLLDYSRDFLSTLRMCLSPSTLSLRMIKSNLEASTPRARKMLNNRSRKSLRTWSNSWFIKTKKNTPSRFQSISLKATCLQRTFKVLLINFSHWPRIKYSLDSKIFLIDSILLTARPSISTWWHFRKSCGIILNSQARALKLNLRHISKRWA